MFLSRLRGTALARISRSGNAAGRRSGAVRRPLLVEWLETRLAPAAASMSLPTSGFSGNAAGGLVRNVPVNVSTLSNGLSAVSIVISFSTGVFSFPVGSNQATADVSFGAIPTGGGTNWNLTANSPADGLLNIALSAKVGKSITSSIAANTLVLVSFPISPSFTPTTSVSEPITIIGHQGTSNTQIIEGGSSGAYTLTPAPPYSGSLTINPIVQQPPTVLAMQTFSAESNTPITPIAPGILTGASDPQNPAL